MSARIATVSCLVAALCLLAAVRAEGQVSGATLSGLIVDETDAVVPDVEISAMNSATGTRRETSSAGDGRFAMPMLPAGTYIVTARRPGFAPLEVRNVALVANASLMLRVQLRVGTVQQSVEVTPAGTGPGQVIEILLPAAGGAAQGLWITGELQRQLPLSRDREFADALFLTSGVVIREGGRHYVHGSGGNSTVVLVDGADLTSNRQAGTSLIQFGPATIEQVEIKTAGMDASMPLTQGAVVQLTTRSGGSRIQGALGTIFASKGWASTNEPAGSASRAGILQPDAALGGPVVRDRLWAFGAFRWSTSRWTGVRNAGQIAILKALVPGWTPDELGAGGFDVLGKLTGRLSPAHQVNAFYQADSNYVTGPGGAAAGPYLRQTLGGSAFGANWSATWSDALLTRLTLAYNDKTTRNDSDYLAKTAIQVHEGVYTSGGVLRGTGTFAFLDSMAGYYNSLPASKLALSGELTWHRRGPIGTHELQIGLSFQPRLRLKETIRFNNNGFLSEEVVLREPQNPAAGFIPFHRKVYEAGEMAQLDLAGQDEGVYLQDRWRPLNRLTVGAGIRLDWMRDRDRLSGRVVRDSLAVGPRLSASFALTPRSALYASWGRIHDGSTAGRYADGAITAVASHDYYDVDLDGTFETDYYVPAMSISRNTRVDVHRSQPYVNELAAGFRQQLPGRIGIEIGVVRREFRAIPATHLQAQPIPGSGFTPDEQDWFRNRYEVTPNRWYYPVVTDLSIQATRQSGRVQVFASYVRNWRHLQGTWVPGDPAAILQPSAFANDKGIGSTTTTTTDSLQTTYAGEDAQDAWIDHSFRGMVVWNAPLGLSLAAVYQVQSGAWSGPIVTLTDSPDPAAGPPAYMLNGLSIQNLISTNLRFAYPTRGEGQLQLPPLQTLNFRIGRRFQTRWGRVESAVDVFNLTNRGGYVSFTSLSSQNFSPFFGKGGSRQRPRSVQVSVRFVF